MLAGLNWRRDRPLYATSRSRVDGDMRTNALHSAAVAHGRWAAARHLPAYGETMLTDAPEYSLPAYQAGSCTSTLPAPSTPGVTNRTGGERRTAHRDAVARRCSTYSHCKLPLTIPATPVHVWRILTRRRYALAGPTNLSIALSSASPPAKHLLPRHCCVLDLLVEQTLRHEPVARHTHTFTAHLSKQTNRAGATATYGYTRVTTSAGRISDCAGASTGKRRIALWRWACSTRACHPATSSALISL